MIQLPKDADGREIPLDTKVLYGSGGTARNIVYWVHTVDSDLEKEWGNCWRAVTDAGRKLDAELMYLTEPDSWEKLEEDLDKCVAEGTACTYFSKDGTCQSCSLSNIAGARRQAGRCARRDLRGVPSRLVLMPGLRGGGGGR